MSRGRVGAGWAALRARTPLRTQLLVAVAALAAVTVLVISLATAALLRTTLLDRVDEQLTSSADLGRDAPIGPPAEQDHERGERFRPPTDYLVQWYDTTGRLVDSSAQSGAQPGPDLPVLDADTLAALEHRPLTVGATSGDGSWRALVLDNGEGATVLALPLDGVEATVRELLLLDAVVGLLALGLLVAAARWAVRASLRPLEEVEDTADAIAGGDLSQRVPARDPRTEVGRLSAALNAMLGQVERAFEAQRSSEAQAWASEQRMRRFVADASHELRTPLTSIRGFAELYRQGAVSDEAGRARAMRRIEEEATRMGLLVEDLLLLARLDQQRPLDITDVDLLPLATDAVHDAGVVAPDHAVRLRGAAGPAPRAAGDERALRQVLANLVRNAVVHTPAGTTVTVSAGSGPEPAEVFLEVADDGPGMTAEDAARVFERFYRADTSRSRAQTPGAGSGLGLPIIAALVAAHGGRVDLRTTPGEATTVRVVLPAARAVVTASSQPAPSAGQGVVTSVGS